RPAAALAGAVALVALGVLPIEETYRSVDWNTIVLLLGMMIVTAHLKGAGFFGLAAQAALARVKTPAGLLAAVVVLFLFSRVPPRRSLEQVDGGLLLFFAALFVLVGGLVRSGVVERLYGAVGPLFSEGGTKGLAAFSAFAVAGSQVVSNVPFVLVARNWIPSFPEPGTMWPALAAASTLAGNLTLLGSVANVIVAEISRDRAPLRFVEFLRVGVPTTLISTAIGVAVLALTQRRRRRRRYRGGCSRTSGAGEYALDSPGDSRRPILISKNPSRSRIENSSISSRNPTWLRRAKSKKVGSGASRAWERSSIEISFASASRSAPRSRRMNPGTRGSFPLHPATTTRTRRARPVRIPNCRARSAGSIE
ncbi:MAG: SLC13 family permease, partial [Planctomycetota bacterium]